MVQKHIHSSWLLPSRQLHTRQRLQDVLRFFTVEDLTQLLVALVWAPGR